MPTRRGATRPPARAITSNEPGSGRRNGRHHPDGHAESEDVAWFVKIGGGSRLTAASRPGCIKDSHQRKSPAQPPTRTTKVLVFGLINAETLVPEGIAGLSLAGDISGRWRAQDFSALSSSMRGWKPGKKSFETNFRDSLPKYKAKRPRLKEFRRKYRATTRCYVRKASMFRISFIGPGDRRSKQTASQSLACSAANQGHLLPQNEAIL